MYIRGLIPRNFAELDEAVPIALNSVRLSNFSHIGISYNNLMGKVFEK